MLGDSLRRRRGAPKAKAEPPEGADRPEGPQRPRRPRRGKSTGILGPVTWTRWLILAGVILAGSFGVGYALSTQLFFPRPETAGTGVPVPDLYGESRADAESTLRGLGLQVGEVREMKSMTTDAGRVLAQDPLPEQQLLPGATVSLGVSAGPPELRIPPLVGLGEATARELLETVGFDVAVQQTRTMEFAAGVVTRAEPMAGTPQRLPTTVTIIVNAGPPADSVPDSMGARQPG